MILDGWRCASHHNGHSRAVVIFRMNYWVPGAVPGIITERFWWIGMLGVMPGINADAVPAMILF